MSPSFSYFELLRGRFNALPDALLRRGDNGVTSAFVGERALAREMLRASSWVRELESLRGRVTLAADDLLPRSLATFSSGLGCSSVSDKGFELTEQGDKTGSLLMEAEGRLPPNHPKMPMGFVPLSECDLSSVFMIQQCVG